MAQEPQSGARAYRAIFFDLDGTLVPMELEDLLKPYYRIIGEHAQREGIDPQAFIRVLDDAIAAMMQHDSGCTNADAFWNSFFHGAQRAQLHRERSWEDFFDEFYSCDYPAIGSTVTANPAAARAVRALQEKGYPLVLATMPLFPRDAVIERLRWADVEADAFGRITSFENSSAVKPSLDYYRENLAACGLQGSDVLMVGNNTKEDLVVMELGADAFLVTDFLLDPCDYDISTVRHGSLQDFAEWVETLPACAHPAQRIEAGALV